jgi:hypothetical protein
MSSRRTLKRGGTEAFALLRCGGGLLALVAKLVCSSDPRFVLELECEPADRLALGHRAR